MRQNGITFKETLDSMTTPNCNYYATLLHLLIHTTTMHEMHESLPRTLSPGAPTPKTTRAAPGWHRCTVQTFSFEGAEVC